MEYELANIDRVRTLYEKFVELFPDNPVPWIKWAELEKNLGENQRFRSIYDLAIANPNLNMPETVWRAYIDNEIDLENFENARNIYEKLVERTKHIKVKINESTLISNPPSYKS